ncbi:TonB-dependent receptor [Sphingobacterium thalpophilum]|uniref:TonB-dependent receptor n=1 Tax=Sphingobacterium thalpophilum TaxID=259 RepID=UPI002D784302|nr:TonB-dependent receptor [Sphingobacterium thalpophilum]
MNFHQVMRVMKITMVLLTCVLAHLSAATFGQRLTIFKEKVLLADLMEQISTQTGYDFFYDAALFDHAPRISIKVVNAPLEQVLERCFEKLPFTYTVKNRIVTIRHTGTENPEGKKTVRGSQTVTIRGRVLDAGTGQPLPGISVTVKNGRNSTSTDAYGHFSIVVPGQQAVLVFTSLGYQRIELGVTAAQSDITVRLKSLATALQEVEVTVQARKRANTEASVLEERRKASIVQDAISAQLIERTGSITTTQALQRVTGVTITDDKYVAVRGLGDRSVIGQLNGVRLASSDPDRSAIPLDLVPASLLDNITVYKTVTPDKPADAASGIVELKTKSVPEKMTFEVIAQTGLNSNIGIGGRYNSFWNSDMGILGTAINKKDLSQDFLSLSRQYPNGLSSIQQLIASSNYSPEVRQEVSRINGIMQGFDPVLTTQTRRAPLNQLYSATFGNSYTLFDTHKLGVILGGNYYRRTSNIYDGDLTQYSIYQGVVTGSPYIYSQRKIPNFTTTNNLVMGKYQTYRENTGVETLNYGVLGGLTYRFNPRHEVSFQYLGSWGGENTATNLRGGYYYAGLPGEVNSTTYSLKQTFRSLHTFNLQGEHKFLKSAYSPRLSYNLASSQSNQNDPDYRFVNLVDYKPRNGGTIARPSIGHLPNSGTIEYVYTERYYALSSGYVNGFGPYGIIQADPNGRRWRNLDETNYNYKADLAVPFQLLGHKQEFKTGFNYLNRERKFGENVLFLPGSNFTGYGSYGPGRFSSIPLYDVEGNLDRLVSNEVVGLRIPTGAVGEGDFPVGGFLYNIQKSPNNYTGFYETNAFYGMLDLKLTDELRIAGGLRFENTNIQSSVDTANVYLDPSLTAANADGTVNLNPQNPNSAYKQGYKPYYSANVTYSLNDHMNFRVAFNTTLARPELREITNVYEFDAFQMGLVVGNRNLKNQSTKNLDFRWEWFPNSGEVIAVSAFGKEINDQLVKVFSLQTQGLAATFPEFPVIQFQNDPNRGRVYGIELELVKNLGAFWEPAHDFFLGSNLLLAQSNIRKTPERQAANWSIDRNAPTNSPLFEQAPYSVNAWLNYNNKTWGTDITATYNTVGERLVQINLTGEPDLYTRPFSMLDLVFSQKLNKRLLFKGYAKNILNPAIKTVYANPNTGGKWYGREYLNRSYKRGTEIMFGFTYNIL